MKDTKRNQPRRAARMRKQTARLRDSLEAKLLKVCADIGWICGWREEPALSARQSSRKRVMLGRALAADARVQEDQVFRPVEVTFVSSGRTAYAQSEPAAEADGLADLALDAQEGLARLGRATLATCSFNEAASRYADHFPRTASRRLVGLRIRSSSSTLSEKTVSNPA